MNALAPAAVQAQAAAAFLSRPAKARPATTYFAVLFTDPWDPSADGPANVDAPEAWAGALRMLAILAEENPGYLGYEVQEMEGGREYAVTRWATPAHIRQWKKAAALVVGDNGLLSRIYGREGCLWPWLEAARQA